MTWSTGAVVTATEFNEQLRDNMNALLPVASLVLRVAPYTEVETAVESRWLQCNGVAVSRTTYSVLFNYLNGLTPALPFGSGDGSTTFTLPDLRGRAVYAEGTNSYVDAMGDSDGLSLADRSPSHKHRLMMEAGGTNGSEPGRGNTLDTGEYAYTSGGGALDLPSYLVVGSWFIKYTS
jgi:hypothetical protein